MSAHLNLDRHCQTGFQKCIPILIFTNHILENLFSPHRWLYSKLLIFKVYTNFIDHWIVFHCVNMDLKLFISLIMFSCLVLFICMYELPIQNFCPLPYGAVCLSYCSISHGTYCSTYFKGCLGKTESTRWLFSKQV